MIAGSTASSRPAILVVEDNYVTATSVCDIVRDCGFAVAGAVARLNSGLDFLAQHEVDGAIVDINLDGTPSFPLCAELDRKRVPFCFLTAYTTQIIPAAFRGVPLLNKPLEVDQIRTALDSLVLRRRALRQEVVGRGNLLLELLPEDEWLLLRPSLEPVELRAGDLLQEPGSHPAHVTFPITGLVSLEAQAWEQRLQVALVGRDGLVGAPVLLGSPRLATRAVVQFPGTAWRASADAFAARLTERPRLRERLLPWVNDLLAQMALNSLANGRATIEQRVARWLLMAADRLDTTEIAVTHDVLAQVLGVRRAGVTLAPHMLEGRHAVRSERRRIRTADRTILAAAAGSFCERTASPTNGAAEIAADGGRLP